MNMRERVRACILAHRTGDALGMPVETMTSGEILALNGGAPLSEMIDGRQRKLTDTSGLKRGQTTDDTQLGDAVIRSLVRCRGFDIADQAREHLLEYETSKFGWGGTTRLAMESFKSGRHPTAKMAAVPGTPGKRPKGRGNGPVMKIHGLPLWHALRQGRFEPEPLLTDTQELGMMTHWDVRASIAAYAVAVVIGKVLHQPIHGLSEDARTDWIRSVYEDDAALSSKRWLLESVIEQVGFAEARCRFLTDDSDTVSKRLKTLAETFTDDAEFFAKNPPGFDAMDSAAFTIGVFLRHSDSIEAGLMEAVNAGGDTDTHAAIAGAMIGANGAGVRTDVSAEDLIPTRWRSVMTDGCADGLKIADALYAAATEAGRVDDPLRTMPRC